MSKVRFCLCFRHVFLLPALLALLSFSLESTQAQTNTPTEPPLTAVESTATLLPSPINASTPLPGPTPTWTPIPAPTVFMEVLYRNNFDSGDLNGLILSDGWEVITSNGDGNLCLTNFNARFGAYPNIRFGSADWENYSVEVMVQITGRDVGHTAILSYLDDQSWGYRHSISFDEWGSRVAQYYYGGENGEDARRLREASVSVESGFWYTLRAEVDGVTLRTIINGELIANYNMALASRGSAGIEAGPGTKVCLDDLVVRSLNRSDAALDRAQYGVLLRGADVRLWPWPWSDRVGAAGRDEEVYMLDVSDDEQWVYIRKQNSSIQGWVWAGHIRRSHR